MTGVQTVIGRLALGAGSVALSQTFVLGGQTVVLGGQTRGCVHEPAQGALSAGTATAPKALSVAVATQLESALLNVISGGEQFYTDASWPFS